MKHTFTTEKGHLIAKVSFDKAEIAAAQDKAVSKLTLNVVVPGFRKGKAPKDMAAKYVHSEDVANETINALLKTLDKNFAKDAEFNEFAKKFVDFIRPNVSLDKFDGDDAEFTVTYYFRPAVSKLGEYKGLTSNVKEKKVTAKDVNAEIEKLALDNSELVPSEKAAEMGDTVNIDFVGLMDGKPFDGGTANSFDLELGSKHFVPGFEEQCVSHKAGEKFDVSLTMPDNYPAPLTGKPVVFKVTLNAVKTKEVPEINDEFATTLSGQYVSKDLAELKTKVKDNLAKKAFDSFKNDTVNDYLLQIRNASEFEISTEVIDHLVSDREKQDRDSIAQQGLDLDEYLKLVNQTKEDYLANLKTGLENELKSSLIYNALAEAEKIAAPSKEDMEKQLGTTLDEFYKNFSNYLRTQKLSDAQISNQINNYLNQVASGMMTANVQAKVLELNDPELAKRTFVPAKPAAKKTVKKTFEAKPEDKKAAEEKAEPKEEPKEENKAE